MTTDRYQLKEELRLDIIDFINKRLNLSIYSLDDEFQTDEDEAACQVIDQMIDTLVVVFKYKYEIMD